MSRGMPILVILSLTRRVQSTRKQIFCDGTHRQTTNIQCNLETESAKREDKVKTRHGGPVDNRPSTD